MSKRKKGEIFLVCTGLGRVRRGFESYIKELAHHLFDEEIFKDRVRVFSGKKIEINNHYTVEVFNIPSSNPFIRKVFKPLYAFIIEQVSFFIFFLPRVIFLKPRCIYLGEYRLYCYLFKARKYLRLNFSLIIYTGGQVFPGLFDSSRDFIHHVTDVYMKNNYPSNCQFLIPHFVKTDYSYSPVVMEELRKKAGNKKIVLSIGLIDKERKRMDFLVSVLSHFPKKVYPVILGQPSNDTLYIETRLEKIFGKGNFFLGSVDSSQLGSYYAAADFFILCALLEPFGLVYLEALYHNLDVFCNDFHESRFVLRDNAIFLDMKNENEVADFLTTYIQKGQRILIGNKGRDYVEQRFSWEHLRENMYKCLRHSALKKLITD